MRHMSTGESRGWIRVSEIYLDRVRYDAVWRGGTGGEEANAAWKVLGQAGFDEPAAALAWARERSDAIVVERLTAKGVALEFWGGNEPRPTWARTLAPLDETAMLARRPAPWPEGDGPFGWFGTPLGDDVLLTELPLDPRLGGPPRDFWEDVPPPAGADLDGPAQARLDRALDALELPRMEHLRETLAAHGLSGGDNMLSGARRCAHFLLPLFDQAGDEEELLSTHLLLHVDLDGVLTEVLVVEPGRHVELE